MSKIYVITKLEISNQEDLDISSVAAHTTVNDYAFTSKEAALTMLKQDFINELKQNSNYRIEGIDTSMSMQAIMDESYTEFEGEFDISAFNESYKLTIWTDQKAGYTIQASIEEVELY